MAAVFGPERRIVPIPAADALFTDTLRAGLEAYLRGDYTRAANYWLDAAAVAGHRPDAPMWAELGASLEQRLVERALVNTHAALTRDAQVRR